MSVEAKESGAIVVTVNGKAITPMKTSTPSPFTADIIIDLTPYENQGAITAVAGLVPDGGTRDSLPSAPVSIEYDTEGPLVVGNPQYQGGLNITPQLILRFKKSDIDPKSVTPDAFKIEQIVTGGGTTAITSRAVVASPDSVVINLPFLQPGDYQISTTALADPSKTLKDLAGNPAGKLDASTKPPQTQTFPFSVLPESKTGPHVEFPQFLPPKVGDREAPFNPDDFVVTRVARLYYNRDAHRVAQIINRNVRSYNRAAVTQAQRAAEDARDESNTRTDDRRAKENDARRQAERLRQAEHELETARDDLRKVNDNKVQLQTQIDRLNQDITEKSSRSTELGNQITAMTPPATTPPPPLPANVADLTAKKSTLDHDIADSQAKLARLKTQQTDLEKRPAELTQQVNTLQAVLSSMRDTVMNKQVATENAQAKEDRAKENQFRKEVAAASEDPDTYAPANLESADPVSQVSISVIGEGVIQLRGPMKGVNKVRTMINQMDAPLGQVKVGIFTVQVNGERANRMENVVRRIEGNVDLSRFMTSHSMMLLRRAVQEVASGIADESKAMFPGRTQVDRDRRYLYAFFGREFIDSLFAMNSEFLFTGNRLLSLNSMDNVSLNRALYVLALAKNDVRQKILQRFMQLVQCDLPVAEFDHRRSSGLNNSSSHTLKHLNKYASQHYFFRSFRSLFETDLAGSDTLNPLQLEFLRMAQIFKSQMVAEVELKQRVIERGLIQDRANDETQQYEMLKAVQDELRKDIQKELLNVAKADTKVTEALNQIRDVLSRIKDLTSSSKNAAVEVDKVVKEIAALTARDHLLDNSKILEIQRRLKSQVAEYQQIMDKIIQFQPLILKPNDVQIFRNSIDGWQDVLIGMTKLDGIRSIPPPMPGVVETNEATVERNNAHVDAADTIRKFTGKLLFFFSPTAESLGIISDMITRVKEESEKLRDQSEGLDARVGQEVGAILNRSSGTSRGKGLLDELEQQYANTFKVINQNVPLQYRGDMLLPLNQAMALAREGNLGVRKLARGVDLKNATRINLDQRKLLDNFIDEKEDKYIELVEGTRSYIATVDAYLKRLTIALEDDCKIQFYDPAFEQIRRASREYDVSLGQVERTTILTNNRQFAKVTPEATMEFDLPKRDIVITEAMKGAKAMVQDYGALLQDPTFLAATSMLSGSPTASTSTSLRINPVNGLSNSGLPQSPITDVLPGLPSTNDQQLMKQTSGEQRQLGASLQALIPDPAIYKFETGTGFEIRPVIQPDGDSIIYDFNYMYTTNVSEPVRPDEKHLGRVKRHYINTQVQTSTYELRELSRYQVALKAARTSRGVPLFEDIPGLGILFRPLPSASSSLQQNIILAQSTVYPTVFDLMGLRWAPYVVDLNDLGIQDQEFVVRGREKVISDTLYDSVSKRVDQFLQVREVNPLGDRPDLYRRQSVPSRNHPGGYSIPGVPDDTDPTGRKFRVPDPRPREYRDPRFDEGTGRLSEEPGENFANPVIEMNGGSLVLPGGEPHMPPLLPNPGTPPPFSPRDNRPHDNTPGLDSPNLGDPLPPVNSYPTNPTLHPVPPETIRRADRQPAGSTSLVRRAPALSSTLGSTPKSRTGLGAVKDVIGSLPPLPDESNTVGGYGPSRAQARRDDSLQRSSASQLKAPAATPANPKPSPAPQTPKRRFSLFRGESAPN